MIQVLGSPSGEASSPAITSHWYAAHVRVNQEKTVARSLSVRGFEAYVPVYKETRQWSDRLKEVELPLFPGYVFCRIEADKRFPVQLTPGVVRLVGSGREPVPIDDSEMATLRLLAQSDVPRQPHASPAVGDAVEIVGGPLAGVFGVLQKVMDSSKLIVTITLLRRSVAVEFDDRWIAVATKRS